MTTDFLITTQNQMGEVKEVSRTLKYKDELLKKRIMEKFEIERVFFERRGIDCNCQIRKLIEIVSILE